MKILFLAPHPFFANRGTPIAVRAALQALSAQGHTIDVVSYHEGTDVAIDNVRHLRIRRPPLVKKIPIGPSWQKILCDVALYRVAKQLLKENTYDIIHAVEESAFMARSFKRKFGVPYIFDMDSLMSLQVREKHALFTPMAKVFEKLERNALKDCAGVLAVCPALVDEAVKYQPQGNVHLLPDIPFTGEQPGELPVELTEATGVRIVYVGNLETYQGMGMLIDAFKLIADDCPDATLVVVGGAAHHIDKYKQQAGALLESKRVRFAGPVPIERLGRVMSYADILASPRLKGNNTPMKIYSYLQSGNAVIATRLPTHTQVLNDDVALLTDATATATAAGLRELIESPSRRAAFGAAGKSYVEAHFSEAAFNERLRTFYVELERNS